MTTTTESEMQSGSGSGSFTTPTAKRQRKVLKKSPQTEFVENLFKKLMNACDSIANHAIKLRM